MAAGCMQPASEAPVPTPAAVAKAANTNTSAPPGDPFRGLSVEYLCGKFLEDLVVDEDEKVYDIEPRIRERSRGKPCPRDGRPGAAYVDVADDPRAGRATIMLSYTWGYRVRDIISALDQFCMNSGENPKDVRVWICCLCVNQWRVIEAVEVGETISFEEFQRTFGERVQGIGRIVAMLSPWRDAMYLKRVWCLFEAWTATNTPGCVLEFVLPVAEAKNYRHCLRKSALDDIWKALGGIRVQDAQASIDKDRQRILELVHGSTDGYAGLNHELTIYLQRWFLQTASAYMEQTFQSNAADDGLVHPGKTALCVSLSDLYIDLGNQQEAEDLCVKGLELCQEMSRRQGTVQKDVDDYQTHVASMLLNRGRIMHERGNLDLALEFWEQALSKFSAQGLGESAEVVGVIRRMGVVHREQGQIGKALRKFNEAWDVLQKCEGTATAAAATLLRSLGVVQTMQGRFNEAKISFERALDIYVSLDMLHNPEVVMLHIHTGTCYYLSGEGEEALERYGKAWYICDQTGTTDGPDAAHVLQMMGSVYRVQGRFVEAEEKLGAAWAIHESAGSTGGLEAALVLMRKGRLALDQGDMPRAAKFLAASWAVYQETGTIGSLPAAAVLVQNGDLQFKTGDYDNATKHYNGAMAIYERHDLADCVEAAACLWRKGRLTSLRGEYTEAERMLKKSVGIYESAGATSTLDCASAIRFLGIVAQQSGDTDESMKHFRASLQIYKDRRMSKCPGVADLYRNIGATFRKKGDLEKADQMLDLAWDSYDKAGATRCPEAASIMRARAVIQMQRGNLTEARDMFGEALEIHAETETLFGDEAASTQKYLGDSLYMLGDFDGALASLQKSIENCEVSGLDGSPDMAGALWRIGRVRIALADLDSAMLVFMRAWKIYSDTDMLRTFEGSEFLRWLGICYYENRDLKKALDKFQECWDVYGALQMQDSFYAAELLANIGSLYQVRSDANDMELAEDKFVEALAVHVKIGTESSFQAALVIRHLGTIALMQDDPVGAVSKFEQAWDTLAGCSSTETLEACKTLFVWHKTLKGIGQPELAAKKLAQAWSILREKKWTKTVIAREMQLSAMEDVIDQFRAAECRGGPGSITADMLVHVLRELGIPDATANTVQKVLRAIGGGASDSPVWESFFRWVFDDGETIAHNRSIVV